MSDSRPTLWAKFWASPAAAPPAPVKPPAERPELIQCRPCGGPIVIGSSSERQHILCGHCGSQFLLEPQQNGTAIITVLCFGPKQSFRRPRP